jgi:predicted RNA-binding protein with PUA-like domain
MRALKKPVGLETIKDDKALKAIPLLKNSRLSVMPLTREQFERVLQLGEEPVKPG